MRNVFLIMVCLMTGFVAVAQVNISGKVISRKDRSPLAGASIKIKGSDRGTLAGPMGEFSIRTGIRDTLLVSYGGFEQAVLVGPFASVLTVALSEADMSLDEVGVSTGYQVIPKDRATGSFVQVDNKLIERSLGTNVVDRLQDIVPGLSFNRYGNSAISIRGQSNIFGNASPLIVIDNFPFEGDLLDINPNDVESITVLKDAAAASIWGARAGNGVIVITSKRGKFGRPVQVNFNTNLTIGGTPDLYARNRLTSGDYIDIEQHLFNQGYYNAAKLSGYQPLSPVIALLYAKQSDPSIAQEVDAKIEALRKQDFREDLSGNVYRRSSYQQYALNLNGGGKDHSYMISGGLDQNSENLVGNSYRRLTFNALTGFRFLRDKLGLDLELSLTDNRTVNNNAGTDNITSGIESSIYPYAKLVDDLGNPLPIVKNVSETFALQAQQNGLLDWRYYPLREIELSDNVSRRRNLRLASGLSYNLMDGLKISLIYQLSDILGGSRNLRSEDSYYVRDLINRFSQGNGSAIVRPIPLGGILDQSEQRSTGHSLRGQVDYSKRIAEFHEIDLLGGYEIRSVDSDSRTYRYYGYNAEYGSTGIVDYTNNQLPLYYDNARRGQIPNTDAVSINRERYLSYYFNASYAYDKRFTLSGSARIDQSNLFGVRANQKGVPLWSAGLSWQLSREAFYRFEPLPYLKLRATYGYNGSVNRSVSAFTTATLTGLNLNQQPYATIINPPNPELRWERVKIMNFGVDFATRANRISGSIEYYLKEGIDLIGDTPFPPSSGVTLFRGNTANTCGKGLDLSLHSMNVEGQINWQTDLTLGLLREKVSRYDISLQAAGSGGYIQYPFALPLEGRPLYALYSYGWAGLDPANGNPRGYLNGEPSSNYSAVMAATNLENMVYNGPLRPTTFGSLINTIDYRQFSLSFKLSYRFGYYFRKASITYGNDFGLSANSGDYALRWRSPGDEVLTNVPSAPLVANAARDLFYSYSDALVSRADNIRLQDIRLSYSPKKMYKGLRTAQLFAYATNLALLWRATSFNVDPDNQFGQAPVTVAVGIRIGL